MCSSSKMEKEMENVRRVAAAAWGDHVSQGSQHSSQRGGACVPGHTLFCIHKHTYSQLVPRDSHISHTHPVTRLCCMLPEA